LRLPNLKISAILLWIFFFYDIFWVFLSEYIFKKNVMVTVATNLPSLPMVIILPRALDDGASLLGAGDIVLPGLFLCYLYRFDHWQHSAFRNGYFFKAWIGYIVGLVVTIIMVYALQRGQPALLYLVPFTMIPTVITGYSRGQLHLLWQGIKQREEDRGYRGVSK